MLAGIKKGSWAMKAELEARCEYAQKRMRGDESYIFCKLLDRTCPLQYGFECADYFDPNEEA